MTHRYQQPLRGPQQVRLTDFDVATDGGEAAGDDGDRLLDAFDADAETVGDAWEGEYLYTSWGYDQTNVDFAQIIEVSESGKTVVCQRVHADRAGVGHGTEDVRPTPDLFGIEFRLHVRSSGRRPEPIFRGSYPIGRGDGEAGTRCDTFVPVTDHDTITQTAPGAGH